MKKFELTSEFITNAFGKKLFRIRSLVEFGAVKSGSLGGYLEKEENLSQEGNAWVYGDAWVSGDAQVSGNARVCGDAQVSGDARVCGDARVYGDAWVSGDARVCGNARVYGDAWVSGNAQVCGNAWVYGNAQVCGNAWVCGDAEVCGDAQVCGDADYTIVKGFGRYARATTFFRCKDKKIRVVCGCFYGDLEAFRAIVKKTHGDGKLAKEYLAIADLMELHFEDVKDD